MIAFHLINPANSTYFAKAFKGLIRYEFEISNFTYLVIVLNLDETKKNLFSSSWDSISFGWLAKVFMTNFHETRPTQDFDPKTCIWALVPTDNNLKINLALHFQLLKLNQIISQFWAIVMKNLVRLRWSSFSAIIESDKEHEKANCSNFNHLWTLMMIKINWCPKRKEAKILWYVSFFLSFLVSFSVVPLVLSQHWLISNCHKLSEWYFLSFLSLVPSET